MSDRDLGLGSEYDAVIVNITSQQDAHLDQHTSFASLALANASASIAQSGNSKGANQQYNRGRRGRGRGNGRGRGTLCQLCGKTGHYSAICYHRFDQSYQCLRPQMNQGGGFQGQSRGNPSNNYPNTY
ncbi:hypothetical protein ACOSQ4_014232 [Xanthoceras sorbifolium]